MDSEDDEIIERDLKRFALGNSILFFACIIYPFGESIFSVLYAFNILGNTTGGHCIVSVSNTNDRKPVPYHGKNAYTTLMSDLGAVDVSNRFLGANIFTVVCMVCIESAFLLNHYNSHLLKFHWLRNKVFMINITVNAILFLCVIC